MFTKNTVNTYRPYYLTLVISNTPALCVNHKERLIWLDVPIVFMESKMIVLVIAAIIILAGIVLIAITEPAGQEGSQGSWGISDISEHVRPYFWHGVALVVLGCVVGLVSVAKL